MNKLDVLKGYIKLKFRPRFRDRAMLEKYQEKQWRQFVLKTLSKSEFYAPYMDENGYIDRNKLPIIEKEEFMESFNKINTVGIDREEAMALAVASELNREFESKIGNITVGLSTGTSGKRGLFLISPKERASWVVMVMDRILIPRWFQKQKVAFFLRANSNLYTSVQSSIYDFNYFDIFRPINDLADELLKYKPNVLAGQPSVLIALTEVLFQKKEFNHWKPKQIISFAEVLHEGDANTLKRVFAAPIREVYQCTEGLLGVSCDHGTMHLNEDNIIIEKEFIGEDLFKPIVTDFTRESQPVIRYRMSDVLKLKSTPCACGSNYLAIEKIIGRDDDVLWVNSTRILPDVLSRKIALATDSFTRYEIVQTKENSIRIEIQSADFDQSKNAIDSVLKLFLAELGAENFTLEFQEKTFNPTNKARKIRNEIQH